MRGNLRRLVRIAGFFPALFIAVCALAAACSFNYDMANEDDQNPNLIMEKAEYVRIENGNPIVRLKAEELRQYESKHTMELDEFLFDQYNTAPEDYEAIPDVNVRGKGGRARLETDTNNFYIDGGVFLKVNSEDITMETTEISWQDKERFLTAPGRLNITRSDGTTLEGTGFSADVRRRSWEFESEVEGSVVD